MTAKKTITRQVTHCKYWADIYWDMSMGMEMCKKGHPTEIHNIRCPHEMICRDCELISYTETIDAKAYAQYVVRMTEKGII